MKNLLSHAQKIMMTLKNEKKMLTVEVLIYYQKKIEIRNIKKAQKTFKKTI